MRARRGFAAVLVMLVAAGCGGGHPRSTPSAATKARLQGDVRSLTVAAARHDLAAVQAAAAALNADAAAAAATGDLPDAKLQDIRSGVARVLADLTVAPAPASSPVTKTVIATTRTPTSATATPSVTARPAPTSAVAVHPPAGGPAAPPAPAKPTKPKPGKPHKK